ncbi:MAG: hypothetical protein Fur0043_12200 [Anaerolineales bacterium]
MTDQLNALTCYLHPNRETSLRCNRCERPICASCAVRTPTGYRCKECVREQRKRFDTAEWYDYLLVLIVAAILSAIASALTILISAYIWGFFILLLGPLAGMTIANIALRLVKGHRSRALNLTLAVSMALGALPVLLLSGLPGLLTLLLGGADLLSTVVLFSPLLWQILYLVTAIPAAYSQFSGLLFRR